MRGRLLIVEDQAIFREGLKKMITSKATGWIVAAEASNGHEAIVQIELYKPDLVLTDIRMPMMDGIGLIRHIYTHKLDTLTVILTGYKDFEYAQTAVQYGVLDYLIKPCTEDTVETMLKKAYEKWISGISKKNRQLDQKKKLQEAALREFCMGLPYDRTRLGEFFAEIQGYEALFLRVTTYFPKGKAYRPQEMSLLQFALINILEELCVADDLGKGRLVAIEADKMILFLPKAGKQIKSMTSVMRDTVYKLLGLHMSVSNAGEISTAEELGRLYRHYSSELPQLTDTKPINHSQQEQVRAIRLNLMSKIIMGFIVETQRQIQDTLEQLKRQSLEESKHTAYSMVLALRDILDKEFHSSRLPELQGARLDELQRAESAEQVCLWLQKMTDHFMAEYEEWRNRSNDGVIGKVLAYLESNYMKECILSELAARFHVNDTYLSKLFKKETGGNFSAYLTKLRMNKARLLLSNTDMKIFEIASMVGYDDPNYFTNVFRTALRMSPTEYRKNYRHINK